MFWFIIAGIKLHSEFLHYFEGTGPNKTLQLSHGGSIKSLYSTLLKSNRKGRTLHQNVFFFVGFFVLRRISAFAFLSALYT